jgi:glucose-1-phosphate thymidylyltransferase
MKLVVLAAGYATRLYPLTLDRPKPLLAVAGKPMLEHVLDRLAPIREIDGIFVVTNSKFSGHFRDWAGSYGGARQAQPITVVDDGTTNEETKLGAIGDLELVLRSEGVDDDDVIVVAGDNLFSEDLGGFGEYVRGRGAPVLAVYDVGSLEAIRSYNAIEVDDDGRITFFEEKPENPRSTLTGIALYFYPRDVLPLVREYVAAGNNADQPGRLVEWLYTRMPVYTWRVPGTWFDIGSKESLAEADRVFSGVA